MSVAPIFKLRSALVLIAALMTGCDSAKLDNAAEDAADPDDGRRMYRDGLLPSGEPLTQRKVLPDCSAAA
jgi:hypothetical protein